MKTADLSDANPSLSLCMEVFRNYGLRKEFSGPIATVKVFDDNILVKEAIETIAPGTVLVVDGQASRRCALVGGNLAERASERGLAGIIVYGSVRDVAELNAKDLGILALGSCPVRSRKEGNGAAGEELDFGGVKWIPGHYVYVDEDGVLLSAVPLTAS